MLTKVLSSKHTTKSGKAKNPKFFFLQFLVSPCQGFASKTKSPYFFGTVASIKQLATNSSSWCSFHIALLVWITTY